MIRPSGDSPPTAHTSPSGLSPHSRRAPAQARDRTYGVRDRPVGTRVVEDAARAPLLVIGDRRDARHGEGRRTGDRPGAQLDSILPGVIRIGVVRAVAAREVGIGGRRGRRRSRRR